MNIAALKQQAAERAVDYVKSGMVVGLGEGSTAVWAIRRIAQLLDSGALVNIVGIPCSFNVESVATELGIPLASLDDHAVVDITIDGADEVDPQLNLIKGGGGALLREKMVAQASSREIIVVDEGKLSGALGTLWPVPIEVVQFSWGATARYLNDIGGRPVLRTKPDGSPFVTDQGNFILDTAFGPMADPGKIAADLECRAGIVEHGMFLDLADEIIVAGSEGIRQIKKG